MTRPYKGGPADGLTCCAGGDVVYFMNGNVAHRYQLDRGTYRHQGKRNVLKHGMDMTMTLRICLECHRPREDYISTVCTDCGSRRYRRI